MRFEIDITASAGADLRSFTASERRAIVDGMKSLLSVDANVDSNRRKQLQPNSLAPWELRLGDFRVFYQVELPGDETADNPVVDKTGIVLVIAIGYKEHNQLYIRGSKVEL